MKTVFPTVNATAIDSYSLDELVKPFDVSRSWIADVFLTMNNDTIDIYKPKELIRHFSLARDSL